MAVTYTTATDARNRVENLDASLTDAMIEEYIYQAESLLDCIMGRSFVSTFSATKHKILSAGAQAWAARLALEYNPATMTDLNEATEILKRLNAEWNSVVALLSMKDVVNYLESL